jgi:hypothetical protein
MRIGTNIMGRDFVLEIVDWDSILKYGQIPCGIKLIQLFKAFITNDTD